MENFKIKKLFLSISICLNFTILQAQSFSLNGITEPVGDSTISATVSGRVALIVVKEGDFIKKGEIVLKFENEKEELELARRKLILNSKIELETAQFKANTLKNEYLTTKSIFDATKSISQEELLQKELEYKLAQSEFERLLWAKEREKIEHDIAASQLEDRIIRAPFDGVVTKLYLKIGESCSTQDPLVRIVDTQQCRLVAYLDSSNPVKIDKDSSVYIEISYGKTIIKKDASIDFISPVADPSSGLREIKASFDNSDYSIQPGITGRLFFKTK